MADRFYASISIGGVITDEQYATLKPALIAAMFENYVIEDYIWGNDSQARMGEFEYLESTLRDLKIPYKRTSEAYAEYTECISQFDGTDLIDIPTHGGSPVFHIETAIELAVNGVGALEALRDKYEWCLPSAEVSNATRADIDSNSINDAGY